MPHNKVWSINKRAPARDGVVQPACGSYEPHGSHQHDEITMHFKTHSTWCNGICEWCYRGMTAEEVEAEKTARTRGGGRGLHGNGAHK